MDNSERKIIDLLVNEFWRLGYFTLSRRMGTYLPEPAEVGKFKVDVIGRQKDKYALGIILTNEDINNPGLIEKISYLASRQSKSTKKPVTLLIGIPADHYKAVRQKLENLDDTLKKNIKLVRISENKNAGLNRNRKTAGVLFS